MSNTIHSRATRIFSWLVVPALLAVGGAAWSSQQPPAIGATGAAVVPEPAPEPEEAFRIEIGEARLDVVEPVVMPAAKAKPAKAKPRCVDYPMYASGDETVRICS